MKTRQPGIPAYISTARESEGFWREQRAIVNIIQLRRLAKKNEHEQRKKKQMQNE